MTKKTASIPRKQPKQVRAKATIEVILEVTAHILVRDGYHALTTNHVAREAGVSIGSIYQYFPSKDAMVAALVDRHLERMSALIAAEVARSMDLPFAEATTRMVGALIQAHMIDPKLYRAVLDEVPRVGRLAVIRELDAQFEALLHAALAARAHSEELAIEDTRLCAFMIVHTAKAITMAALLEHPEYVQDGRLATELTRMIVRYASPAPAPRKR